MAGTPAEGVRRMKVTRILLSPGPRVKVVKVEAAVSELFECRASEQGWEGTFRGGFATTRGGGYFQSELRPAFRSSAERIGKRQWEKLGARGRI
jgi:hypothetical protein